ncbi:hypothetical protein ASE85_11020 [Sphingobium sp. Leaf26]|nr:hypothetical protein ASE85_11020 [Sphingobium sp. Leaf26]
MGLDIFDNPKCLERAHGFAIDVRCAREGEGALIALQDNDRSPLRAEQCCQNCAYRTKSGNADIIGFWLDCHYAPFHLVYRQLLLLNHIID